MEYCYSKKVFNIKLSHINFVESIETHWLHFFLMDPYHLNKLKTQYFKEHEMTIYVVVI